MKRTWVVGQVLLAAVAMSAATVLAPAPAASAAGGGHMQSCDALQNAISHAANAVVLKQFVDHGCQPPPAPPFTAPSACANWEPPPTPAWCYPPPLPVSIGGGAGYDSYPVGATASRTFTVTNQTTASFDVTAVVIGGPDASDFTVTADQCSGITLAGGGSCGLTVSFAPSAARAFSAILAVSTTATGVVYSQLSGDGPVAPLSFHLTTSPADLWDYRNFDFLPPTMTGDAPDFGVINYTYTPNYSNVDVTTVDGDGLPYHGSMTATLTSDNCPSQVQGGPTYTFTAADGGTHRFLTSLGDAPTFTAVCTLRVHDLSGVTSDGTASGHVVGELCNDTDDNGNGAADELYPQVPVTPTAPNGTFNNNPRVAQSVTVGTGTQQQTGAWGCSADRTRVVPLTASGVVL